LKALVIELKPFLLEHISDDNNIESKLLLFCESGSTALVIKGDRKIDFKFVKKLMPLKLIHQAY
jgi:hypothetical protein